MGFKATNVKASSTIHIKQQQWPGNLFKYPHPQASLLILESCLSPQGGHNFVTFRTFRVLVKYSFYFLIGRYKSKTAQITSVVQKDPLESRNFQRLFKLYILYIM